MPHPPALQITSLTVAAKTVRDVQLADLFPDVPWMHVVHGTPLWQAQAVVAALVAVLAPFATVLHASKAADWSGELGFLMLALSFLVSSTLNVTKATRDRSDADFFELRLPLPSTPAGVTALRASLDQITAGTSAFILLNGLSLVCSFVATLAGVYNYPNLVIERKALVTVGIFFMAYAAFQAAKVTRDLHSSDPGMREHLNTGYTFATYGGFALSLALLFGALLLMPITPAQRKFCATGSAYVLASTLAFAKLLRDGEDRRRAQAKNQ